MVNKKIGWETHFVSMTVEGCPFLVFFEFVFGLEDGLAAVKYNYTVRQSILVLLAGDLGSWKRSQYSVKSIRTKGVVAHPENLNTDTSTEILLRET